MPKNFSKFKKPLVSIILRTKNEERTVGKVLQALYQQTFKNFEIIHVDDNSTDKTLEIVKKYSQKLRIKTICLKVGEFSHPYSQNLGASSSSGKYLCFLTGHSLPISDFWLADGLSNFKKPGVAAVSGYYTEIPIGYFSRKLGRLTFLNYQRKKRKNWTMTNTNSLIRKSLWDNYPFDEKLTECEDYDWALEMIARGYNIIHDPKFNVFHSHLFLGQRVNYLARRRRWKKIIYQISKRKRPRNSFTRLKG